jgi:glycosyltransferase involved in cell wall biosynthesis
MKKSTFFIGVLETGDVTLRLSQGLRELGYPVSNVVVEPSTPIMSTGHDRYVKKSGSFLFLAGLSREFVRSLPHDVFVFNYSASFFSTFFRSRQSGIAYLDLAFLKSLGKNLVIISNGDDLRSYPGLIRELERDGLSSHAYYLQKEVRIDPARETLVQKRAQFIEKYADYIFAKPDRAQHLTREYFTTWPGLDMHTIQYKVVQSDIPVIVHAPSYRLIKGTEYVLKAVRRLEKEGYSFRFLLCENIPNDILRKRLTDSEIVIDQLLLPGYGLVSIEAMAGGNAVVGGAVPGYNRFPEDLPIVTTTPDTIYENLKLLLEDPGLRVELAEKGRRYVETYHDYRKVARNFLETIGVT